MSDRPGYLTVAEAADLARCSVITVRRAIQSEALRAFRPTGRNRLLLREDDVREWIEGAPTTVDRPQPQPLRPSRRSSASGEEPGSVADLRRIERKAASG